MGLPDMGEGEGDGPDVAEVVGKGNLSEFIMLGGTSSAWRNCCWICSCNFCCDCCSPLLRMYHKLLI